MKKLISLLCIAAIFVMLVCAAVPTCAITTEYVIRYKLPTASAQGWALSAATTAQAGAIKHDKHPSIMFTSDSNKISFSYDFIAESFPINKNSSNLALMFYLYISNADSFKTGKNSSGAFFLSVADTTYSWDFSQLSPESGWTLVTLNLRTADVIEKHTEFPTEEQTVQATDTEGNTTTQTVYIAPEYARFGMQIEKSDLSASIALDDLRIVTLILKEDATEIVPIKDEIDEKAIVIAIIAVAAITIIVIIACRYYAEKELRRRRKLRRRKKHEAELLAADLNIDPPEEDEPENRSE